MEIMKQSDLFFVVITGFTETPTDVNIEILGRNSKMRNSALFQVIGPPSSSPNFQEGAFINTFKCSPFDQRLMRKLPVANSTKNTFFDFSAFSTKVDGAHPNTNSSEELNSFFFVLPPP